MPTDIKMDQADVPAPAVDGGSHLAVGEAENTDMHLWPIVSDEGWPDKVHATANGAIGMDVGGHVIVKTIRAWHALAARDLSENKRLREALERLQMAEAQYRRAHDFHGGGDTRTGRAWDLMRRAGDVARTALKEGNT